jgi:hypothetical protein
MEQASNVEAKTERRSDHNKIGNLVKAESVSRAGEQ